MNEYARYEDEDDGMGAGTMAALLAAGATATPVGRPIRKLIGKGANKVAPKLAGKAQDAMRKAANAKLFDPLKGGAMSRAVTAGRDATAGMGGSNWADTLGNIQATGVAPWAAAKSLYKDARAGLGGKVPEAPMQPEPSAYGRGFSAGTVADTPVVLDPNMLRSSAARVPTEDVAPQVKSGVQWKPGGHVNSEIPNPVLGAEAAGSKTPSPTPEVKLPPSVRDNSPDELALTNMVGMSGKPRESLVRKNLISHNGTMKGQAKPKNALLGAMDDTTPLTAAQIEALDPTFAAGVEKLRQAGVSPQRINLIMRMGDTLSRGKGGNKTSYQTVEQLNSFVGKAITGRKP